MALLEEFDHYLRIVTESELDKVTAKSFFDTVLNSRLGDYVNQLDDGTVMIEHNRPDGHCYDIPLSKDLSRFEGDYIASHLMSKFHFDFEIEASAEYLE
jgi:hypothetical protein